MHKDLYMSSLRWTDAVHAGRACGCSYFVAGVRANELCKVKQACCTASCFATDMRSDKQMYAGLGYECCST